MLREDFVDGVEMLLRYEEENVKEGQPYSWEIMDTSVANFTADITPLILAAHRWKHVVRIDQIILKLDFELLKHDDWETS